MELEELGFLVKTKMAASDIFDDIFELEHFPVKTLYTMMHNNINPKIESFYRSIWR